MKILTLRPLLRYRDWGSSVKSWEWKTAGKKKKTLYKGIAGEAQPMDQEKDGVFSPSSMISSIYTWSLPALRIEMCIRDRDQTPPEGWKLKKSLIIS